MKKVLMILLSAMLVLSMAGAVSADEIPVSSITQEDMVDSDDDNDNIVDIGSITSTVILALKEMYTVSIPSQINLLPNSDNSAYVGQANLKVSVIRLDSGHSLELSVSSENATAESWMLTLVNDEGVPILNAQNQKTTFAYRLGYGTTNQHIDAGAVEIESEGPNAQSSIRTGITASILDYYIHAKLPMPSNGVYDSGYYQDNLKFTVKVKTEDDTNP